MSKNLYFVFYFKNWFPFYFLLERNQLFLCYRIGKLLDHLLKKKIVFVPNYIQHFSSVQSLELNCVVSDSLRLHGLWHARPPCPSPIPGAYSNSCPLSQWCHPTVSSSVIPFFSHLQSFPASGSFQMSQFFASGGRNIVVSASASVLPMNIQDWFSLGWTGWISLQSQELSSSPTPQFKSISSALSFLYIRHLLTANLNGLGEFICQNI